MTQNGKSTPEGVQRYVERWRFFIAQKYNNSLKTKPLKHKATNQKERTIGINPFCAFCVILPSPYNLYTESPERSSQP